MGGLEGGKGKGKMLQLNYNLNNKQTKDWLLTGVP